jgi:putative hydrolases of HD superfamily
MIPLRVLERINELKRVPRSGWLLAGIRTPESVADHTCATALLAVFLAQQVNADYVGAGLAEPLDVGRVANLALVHDFAESVLTDLPRRSTEVFTKRVKHAAEAQVMHGILADVAGEDAAFGLWAEYRDVASAEAKLVHDADKLELVYQALCYEQQGQRNLDDYWEDHQWHYEASAELFHRILSLRMNGRATT